MRRFLIGLILGAVIGASAVVPVAGRRVERLELERRQLVLRLAEVESRWERLREDLQARQRLAVQSVAVDLAGVRSSRDRLELEKALRPVTDGFVGLELSRLDPTLVVNALSDRDVEVGDLTFRLRLRAVVLGPEMRIYYEVEEERNLRRS